MCTPAKLNIRYQKRWFGKCVSFQNMAILGIYLKLQGGILQKSDPPPDLELLQIRIRPDLAGRTWHDKLEVAPRVFWGPGWENLGQASCGLSLMDFHL